MDSIQKVNKICKAIKALSDEDFAAIEEMASGQVQHFHPLKHATAVKINKTGEYNLRVLEALKQLQNVINSFEK